jgi:hypothetical protein
MRKKRMMRRRKALMKELGFLPWPNVLYLQARTNGPLERQGPKYTSGFLSADGINVSRKKIRTKKRRG